MCLQRRRDIAWNTTTSPRNQVSVGLSHPTQCSVLQPQSQNTLHQDEDAREGRDLWAGAGAQLAGCSPRMHDILSSILNAPYGGHGGAAL